jgi:hypothetical protein
MGHYESENAIQVGCRIECDVIRRLHHWIRSKVTTSHRLGFDLKEYDQSLYDRLQG